ncbi:MAG TPA: MYXO-CTERM sorting domain-containing protein [Kofleriaceae bacterium]|nr:MYXO-CTERM sorting domain-containing protein [Kofleriaceae bacterium]
MAPIKQTMRSRAALLLGAAAFLSAADAPAGPVPATIGHVAAHRDDLASHIPAHEPDQPPPPVPDRRDPPDPDSARDGGSTLDPAHRTTTGCEAMGVSDGAAGALLLLAGALLSAVLRRRRQAGRED